MNVRCLRDVYGKEGALLFKADVVYGTYVYKGTLSAHTEEGKLYPYSYEVISHSIAENWNSDEWFRHYFEIVS